MQKSECASLVMMLLASFPHSRATEATSAVYEEMLLDLDFGVAKQAVQRLIGTETFLPTIAAIRESCLTLTEGPKRKGEEAWADALEQVRVTGWCGVPTFKDPLVSEALRLWGSWQQFCESPSDDPGGRARFIAHYDALATRARDDRRSGVPYAPALRANRDVQLLVEGKAGGVHLSHIEVRHG